MKNEKTIQVAVYGSLRKGEYNYDHFKRSFPDMEYTGTHTIRGYNLYSLGSYPAVTVMDGDKELIIDTFNVSENCFSRMNGMEIGAGYSQHEITVEDTAHIMWVMPDTDSWLREDRIVEDGDWSKHVREKEAKTKTY